jgi:hypothetical protein
MTGFARILGVCDWGCGSSDTLVLTMSGGPASGMTVTFKSYNPF